MTAVVLAAIVFPASAAEAVAGVEGLALFGIPIDFILFGLTLLGVALFHRHTLIVALAGLAVITAYKLGFTGFKTGAGLAGLGQHMLHEWVILTNLLGLLLGFALLSNHFEKSHVPAATPERKWPTMRSNPCRSIHSRCGLISARRSRISCS